MCALQKPYRGNPRYVHCTTFGDKRDIVSPSAQPSVGGVTVSIVAFQAVDPGSTPGQRRSFFPCFASAHGVDPMLKYNTILLFSPQSWYNLSLSPSSVYIRYGMPTQDH